MKVVVFLLLLANLLFFAWREGYFGQTDNPDAVRVNKQIQAAQLKVVASGEPPAAKSGEPPREAGAAAATPGQSVADKTVGAPPAAETCIAWGGLSASDADRLAVLLTEKFEDFRVNRHALEKEGKSWWVYVPPLANKAEADKKAVELKKLGIDDFLIVTESGPNHWAISLGVFSTEAGAQKRLAILKEKGVKSARHGVRGSKESSYTIEARGPEARKAALNATTAAIASMKLEARECK